MTHTKQTTTACGAFALALAITFSLLPTRASAAPPEPGSPAAKAIERYVTWLGGWERIDAMKDLSFDGVLRTAGLSGPISVRLRRDGRFHTEYDLKVIRGGGTVTPEDAWSIGAGGQIEAMGAAAAEDQRRSLGRAFYDHLRGIGVDIQYLGEVQKEGRTWETVRFIYPDGDEVDLLLDPHDGSREWQLSLIDTEEIWDHTTDWREVDGLRFPFRDETIGKDTASGQILEWEAIAVNTGFPDDVFQRPEAGRKPIRIASGGDSTDWSPLDLFERRYLFLHGTVNGVETDLVLDSGAGMTVLDRAFAEKLGLKPQGEVEAKGAGGTSTASMVPGINIRVAGLAADSLTAAVIDLSGVEQMMQRPMPVILGQEVFNNLVVDLDYPRQRIRFFDPASFRYQGAGHKLPLYAMEGGHREIELQVESLAPARFHLDTGSGGTLGLYHPYTEENHLLEGREPVSESLGGGVGGQVTTHVATLHTVTIAGYALQNVPAAFFDVESSAFDTRRQAGNLGAGILSRFRIYFDYTHEALWLEPGEGWDTAPFRKDRTGLTLRTADAGLDVVFVSPGSPAEKAGWKKDDRIVAVDGKPIDPASYEKDMSEWVSAPAGTEVTLTLAGGEVRRLRLADYY